MVCVKTTNQSMLLFQQAENIFFGELYKRDGMENTIKVSFEGHNWEIAKNYNDYLTKLYGNYMEIPSEENRETHFRSRIKIPR